MRSRVGLERRSNRRVSEAIVASSGAMAACDEHASLSFELQPEALLAWSAGGAPASAEGFDARASVRSRPCRRGCRGLTCEEAVIDHGSAAVSLRQVKSLPRRPCSWCVHRVMLRSLRSIPPIRRLLAVLVGLALMAGALEAGLPDVHERQAGVWRSAAGVNAAGSESVSASVALAEQGPGQRGDRPGQSPSPAHDFHVEHCGHAHTASRPSTPQADEPCLERARRPIARIATLRSVASTPSLRPPIA